MAPAANDSALRELVKRHHVHYSVEPEWVITGDGRCLAGFDVRLFAAHTPRAHALPGDASSRELTSSLRSLAEAVLPEGAEATRVFVEAPRHVLYESREVPGADEVELTVRVLRDFGPDVRATDGADERALQDVRQRLSLLETPER